MKHPSPRANANPEKARIESVKAFATTQYETLRETLETFNPAGDDFVGPAGFEPATDGL
jgi:hypothetical protein